MSKDIQIDSKGVRFSYSRFLADSAAGFIWILIVASFCYHPYFGPLPPIGTEFKAIGALIIFLLSTPVGLATNGLTHALLERKILAIKNRFVREPVPFVESTWKAHDVKGLKIFLGFDQVDEERGRSDKNREGQTSLQCRDGIDIESEWHTAVNYIEKALWLFRPTAIEGLFFLEGLGIFLRNLVLMTPFFMIAAYFWYSSSTESSLALSVGAVATVAAIYLACKGFLKLAASIFFYFEVQVLSRARVLSEVGQDELSDERDYKEIARWIARIPSSEEKDEQ